MVAYYLVRLLHKLFPLNAVRGSRIDRTAKLSYGIQMVDSSLGRYSYIGEKSTLLATEVASFCSIAECCTIGGPAHPLDMVSSSPVFVSGRNIFRRNFAETAFQPYLKTQIGNDVWIGSNAIIKSGVHIGDGAVIGMGSVVTHDVPPYEIWAGNPAKCIRKRFDDDTIRALLQIRWWDWDETKLRECGPDFRSPAELIRRGAEQ